MSIPDDDLSRDLTIAKPNDSGGEHLGVVGDTYTILLDGAATAGKYTLIDMHVPPGGGPPPHRHDFEESFTVLEGELTATFRGETAIVRAGETVHVPANAPHQFRNDGPGDVRMLCLCAPAGQEEFFREIGVRVATRTAAPPPLDETGQKAMQAKVGSLLGKYRTEMLAQA